MKNGKLINSPERMTTLTMTLVVAFAVSAATTAAVWRLMGETTNLVIQLALINLVIWLVVLSTGLLISVVLGTVWLIVLLFLQPFWRDD